MINIAGRQRMLGQKIAELACYVPEAGSADAAAPHRKELEEALRLWQRSHVGLLRGDLEMGLPGRNSNAVVELFGQLQPHHEAIVMAARAILSSSESAAALARRIHGIRDREADFLKGMNDITFQYDREANAKVAFARWLEIGLMSITLLVLLDARGSVLQSLVSVCDRFFRGACSRSGHHRHQRTQEGATESGTPCHVR